jgi:hypothetical protein
MVQPGGDPYLIWFMQRSSDGSGTVSTRANGGQFSPYDAKNRCLMQGKSHLSSFITPSSGFSSYSRFAAFSPLIKFVYR